MPCLAWFRREPVEREDLMGNFFNLVGQVADLAGAVGGVFAAFGVLRLMAAERRLKERVEVVLKLQGDGKSIILPLELLRRDVSRAELLGRLGMLPMREKGSRFSIRAIASPAIIRELNAVVEGKSSTIVIPVTGEEIEQFDL
jgi:hypothetical protein